MPGEEVGLRCVAIHVERLVGGHDDPGVLLRVAPRHSSRVAAKDVLKGAKGLGAQLVTVADEQRAAELARIRNAAQQVDRDEGLARAGGQR